MTTSPRLSRATFASTVGTALEWYDFSLYGTASALVFAHVFFPSGNEFAATLASLGTFAVGFFARPIGGIIIGLLGDRVGRRQMLFVTLLLMAVSSTAIGLLPTHSSIGIWAPVILVVLRIFQGLGAGGEYAGAMLLSAEHAVDEHRGLNAAIPSLGNAIGALLATAVFFVTESALTQEQFLAWGWRIPFLLSLVLAIAAFIIRLRVSESPEFQAAGGAPRTQRIQLLEVLRRGGRRIPLAMLMSIAPNVLSYLPSVYALTYLANQVGAPAGVGLLGVIIANALKIVTVPIAGWLSDRFGGRIIMIIGSLAGAVLVFPFFVMLDTGTPVVIWAAFVLIFTLCCDMTLASQATMLSTLFEVDVRYASVTFSRELIGAIVGGSIPFVAAALTGALDGRPWLVAAYCAVLCAICAAGTWALPEQKQSPAGDGRRVTV
ncbi:MFS transporter [Brachybacterium sacelli]|uniref:MFS family permease n=1 Tax=Brachybacterium sacelli TaxID=173364 RepID=A0ABS4WZF0_9MICO|nr:MFS transporter [Brachybacterium sacelli]MBP2381353.1 MFS family permease [Brachybacterium sacelli]